MAVLTFPVSLSTFFGSLAKVEAVMYPMESVLYSQTGKGEGLAADYGTRLWTGRVLLNRKENTSFERINALIYALQDAGSSFLVTPPHISRPLLIPDVDTCTLEDIQNSREIKLSGLGSGDVMTTGDFLSFTYGSPTRYSLHQVVTGITADGSGDTDWFEVTPAISANAVAGGTVTLFKPVCKAKMVPGTFQPGSIRSVVSDGASFEWKQTLR